jgi:putative addiction module killer protein
MAQDSGSSTARSQGADEASNPLHGRVVKVYPSGYTSLVQIESTPDFKRWLDDLNDLQGRARVQARIQRLADGNPGQHRQLTDSVSELKIDYGPGYRVYYTKRKNRLVILLVGGDKSTQRADIRKAIELAVGL